MTTVVKTEKPGDSLNDLEARIVLLADRWMRRAWSRDEHGFFNATDMANALRMHKREVRRILESLTSRGHLRSTDFVNGKAWRSIDLLPFEVHRSAQSMVAP